MAQKLNLTAYLEQRGKKAKALTKIEAEVFGIAYPLQSGWPRRHGAMEITAAMIEQIEAKAALASQSLDRKARRSGKRATAASIPAASGSSSCQVIATAPAAVAPVERLSTIPGFALRQARRYRTRRQAPWA